LSRFAILKSNKEEFITIGKITNINRATNPLILIFILLFFLINELFNSFIIIAQNPKIVLIYNLKNQLYLIIK